MKQKEEYILPARVDDTLIPGLPATVGFIDLKQTTPSELADLALRKLGKLRTSFLPPVLDRLYEHLDVSIEDQPHVRSLANSFFRVLSRINPNEREVVLGVFSCCCADIGSGIHVEADTLSRHTKKSVEELKLILGGIHSFGFKCSVEYALHTYNESTGDSKVVETVDLFRLHWEDQHYDSSVENLPDHIVALGMVSIAADHYCEKCTKGVLERLDFSYLSIKDASEDRHR